MQKITINEWLEYFAKINILGSIQQLVPFVGMAEFDELETAQKCVYYNLYPEYIANQYSNLDFRTLITDLNGVRPSIEWESNKLSRLTNLTLPLSLFPILRKVFLKRMELTDNEYTEYALVLEDIYERCFEKHVASILIDALYKF